MKGILKYTYFSCLLTIGLLTFTSCDGSGSAVENDRATLAAMNPADFLTAGDTSVEAVTQDLSLPVAGLNGTLIQWTATYSADNSDASAIVTGDGKVSRPAQAIGDAALNLRATISKGTSSDNTTVFQFTIQDLYKFQPADLKAGDQFGLRVATSGDGNTLVMGAYHADGKETDSGAAYIYRRNGDAWDETKLTATDGVSGDRYGYSVAVSANGKTIVVGAPHEDDDRNDPHYGLFGAVYIYRLNGSTWQETKFQALSKVGDELGDSVSISEDGNTIAVGVPYDHQAGTEAGAVHIFRLTGETWDRTRITLARSFAFLNFGSEVVISGDGNSFLVTAPENSMEREPTTFLFQWKSGEWVSTGLPDAYNYSNASMSLSYDGSVFVLQGDEQVQVYRQNGSEWVHSELVSSDWVAGDKFGSKVSLSSDGNNLLIGAYKDDDQGEDSGSAYIFNWDGQNWNESKLLPEDGMAGDFFGRSVSISRDGSTLLIGSASAVYIFRKDGDVWK